MPTDLRKNRLNTYQAPKHSEADRYIAIYQYITNAEPGTCLDLSVGLTIGLRFRPPHQARETPRRRRNRPACSQHVLP